MEEIRNKWQSRKRRIKTIELIVGAGIIMFLMYTFLMQIISARRGGKMTICATNLKCIGWSVQMYIEDYNNWFPPAYYQSSNKYWFEILKPYLSYHLSPQENKLVCPFDKSHIWRGTNYVYNGHYGYFSNYKMRNLSDFKHPEDSLLLVDGKPDVSPVFTQSNYIFCVDVRHPDPYKPFITMIKTKFYFFEVEMQIFS